MDLFAGSLVPFGVFADLSYTVTQTYLIAAVAIVVLLLLALLLLTRRSAVAEVDKSTSLNERMFAPVLEKAVGGQYRVVAKVALDDVFEPLTTLSKRAQRKASKSLQGRLFDFLVVDKFSGTIICAVELDEHKFDKKTFKKQDLYLEQLCQKIGLPLLRVPSQRGYNLSELIERFERIIEPAVIDAERITSAKVALQVKPAFAEIGIEARELA